LELTGNQAQSVGFAVMLQVLPQAFGAPIGGMVNDRMRRKTIMIGADLVRFAIVLGMLTVRTPGLVWLVYPLLFVETTGAAFFEPSRSAVIPNIVPRSEMVIANALGSITWSFNLAIGSMLGGLVAAVAGRDAVFVINGFSFLLSAWLIRRMSFDEPHVAGAKPLRAADLVDFTPLIEGIRYIRRDLRLRATVFVKGGIGLLGAHNVLLPVLGTRVFPVALDGLSPERASMLGMSLLLGARGVGALLGPLMTGLWAGDRHSRLRHGIVGGFLAAAVGYVCLGAAASLPVALITIVLAHGGASTNWVFSTTLLQHYTDDRFRGRVFAADLSICMLVIAAGSFIAGTAIDWGVPVKSMATIVGLIMLIPAGAWTLAVRAIERHSQPR
jgi:MFS family permease